MAIFLSGFSGIFIAVMVRLNASLSERIGVLESTFIIHFVGALVGFLSLLPFFQKSRIEKIRTAPKYLFLSGVLGVFIVMISNAVIPMLGMVLTIGLFLSGSLIFSVLSDHFGFFGLPVYKISPQRILGLLCAITGLMLVL